MPEVIRFGATREPRRRHVTNLGWLLAHTDEVSGFAALTWPEPGGADDGGDPRVLLVAFLAGGDLFLSRFGSRRTLEDWIRRPSFRDLPLVIDGAEEVC